MSILRVAQVSGFVLAACVAGLVFTALGTVLVHTVDNFTRFRSERPLKVIAVNHQNKMHYRCSEISVFIEITLSYQQGSLIEMVQKNTKIVS